MNKLVSSNVDLANKNLIFCRLLKNNMLSGSVPDSLWKNISFPKKARLLL